MKQVTERRLRGVRRDDRPAGRLDELRHGAQLITGSQQRARDDAIDVRLLGERLEVRRRVGEPRGGRARPHDERADAGERRGDRVGQAEREKIRLGIGAQHPEGQHDEARQRARRHRRVVFASAHVAELVRHRLGGRGPLGRFLGEGAADHAIDRRDGRRSRQRRRLLVYRRVQNRDDRAADERGPAREHLEQDGAGREQVGARVHRLAEHLLRRHVVRRAHDDARARELGCGVVLAQRRRPRQAEIEQLHAMRRQEHVRRLEIAVNDAAAVQRGERAQHAEPD